MNNNPFNRNRQGFSPIYNPRQGYPEEQQLHPMGQYLSTPSPVKPETIPQYDTAASKKILGMPVDRFSSLLGTLAAAIAPGTAQGRFGAGMVRMGDMLRQERVYQGKQESAAMAAKRREKGKAPTVRSFRVGSRDIQHAWDPDTKKWKPIPGMEGKEVISPKVQRDKGFKQIEGVWHTGTWGKGEQFAPRRKATKAEIAKLTEVKPGVGKKPKEPTFAEKRARRKEVRGLEATILGVEPKTGKPNIEYEESQIAVDSFNELSDKSYVFQRIPSIPEQAIDWRRDIPEVPAQLEKIPISQFKAPEDIMVADYLSDRAKRRLLLKLFPKKFE